MTNPKLRLFFVSQSLAFTYFWIAISIPYLMYRGLSSAQAFSLMAIYQLFGVFLEYPTGILGDRFGYRKMIYLANTLNCLAMIIMSLRGGYYLYLFALFILSLGNGFSSGNDMGILKSVSTNIKKDAANYNALCDFVLFFGAIIGGLMSRISFEFTLIVSGLCMIAANIPMYLLRTAVKQTKNTNSIRSIISDGLHSLQKPTFKQLFIIVALFGGYSFTTKSIFGSFGTQFNLNITTIGIIVGVLGLVRGLGSKIYAEYPRFNLLLITLLISVSIFFAGMFPQHVPDIGIILFTQFLVGYVGSKIDGDIHNLASDHVRASLFSLKRLSIRLVASSYLAIYGLMVGAGNFSLYMYGTGMILLLGVFFARQYLRGNNLKSVGGELGVANP